MFRKYTKFFAKIFPISYSKLSGSFKFYFFVFKDYLKQKTLIVLVHQQCCLAKLSLATLWYVLLFYVLFDQVKRFLAIQFDATHFSPNSNLTFWLLLVFFVWNVFLCICLITLDYLPLCFSLSKSYPLVKIYLVIY